MIALWREQQAGRPLRPDGVMHWPSWLVDALQTIGAEAAAAQVAEVKPNA